MQLLKKTGPNKASHGDAHYIAASSSFRSRACWAALVNPIEGTMEELLTSITWHHMAFVFGLVFIVVFRAPLSRLIERITKINRDGVIAEPTPETQREQSTGIEAVQKLLDIVGASPVINEQEENIRKDLTSKGLSVEGDTVRVLVKHLAGTQLLLAFERIHSSIFGSQIVLLKSLNEVAGQGRPLRELSHYFEQIRNNHEDALGRWNLEQYLSFLFSYSLIVRNDNQFHITNLGVEYLTWMVRNGRREDHPL